MRLLPTRSGHRCTRTPYASEFGARRAAVLLGLPGRAAHQCEHCPHTWHTGPAPKRAKAVA